MTALPKVELHCHLDGLLTPAMVRDLIAEGRPIGLSPAALDAVTPARGWDGLARWGQAVAVLRGNLAGFRPILAHHIARLTDQHVIYAEVMISPSEIPRDPGAAVAAFQDLRAWTDQHAQGHLRVEFLATCNRKWSADEMESRAKTLLRLHERDLIVGVALAGVESGHPVRPFARTFARLRAAGLGIEIHAGETGGPEAVWDALMYGTPHRIGHGLGAFADAHLLETIRTAGIHVEMCPTSNIRTGSLLHLSDHPIARARALGVSLSINTDDPGAFGCTMNSEYGLVATVFGFDAGDFAYVLACGLAARFGGDPLHQQE